MMDNRADRYRLVKQNILNTLHRASTELLSLPGKDLRRAMLESVSPEHPEVRAYLAGLREALREEGPCPAHCAGTDLDNCTCPPEIDR